MLTCLECPAGWTYFAAVNKCFWESDSGTNWADAQAECKARSDNTGYLAEPRSSTLAEILRGFIPSNTNGMSCKTKLLTAQRKTAVFG